MDVDRGVRQAVRAGKQLRKSLLREGALALVSSEQDKEMPTMLGAENKEIKARAPDTECMDSANRAPMCSEGKPWRTQGASSIVSRTPSPVAPFCVDISLQAFRSFLDLIKGVRQVMSAVPAATARKPVGVEKAGSSTVPDVKHTTCKAQTADPIGPESFEEPTTVGPGKIESIGKPSKQQHAAPGANLNGFALTPRSTTLGVLRGTLKLLKVNLFHLVRVAAMRRACRGNCVVPLSSEIERNPVSSKGHERSRRETKRVGEGALAGGVVGGSDRLDDENTPAAAKGTKFEALGREGYSGVGGGDEDMRGVIRDLHAEIRAILEEPHSDTDPETTDAVFAVQVSNVLHCRLSLTYYVTHNVSYDTPIDRTISVRASCSQKLR